jgi:hypothetical protein
MSVMGIVFYYGLASGTAFVILGSFIETTWVALLLSPMLGFFLLPLISGLIACAAYLWMRIIHRR